MCVVCYPDILGNMKRHTTVRLSEKTDEQLRHLAELYGSQTTAIAIAIDRLARDELPERGAEEDVKPPRDE